MVSEQPEWKYLSTTGTAPLGRSSTGCAVIDDKLLVFSGERVPRVPVDSHLHILDMSNNQWEMFSQPSEDSPWPCARVGHATTITGGKFYLYGGRTTYEHLETLDDFWEFDPVSLAWTQLQPVPGSVWPCGLSYHAMTSTNDHIFLFGGCKTKGRSNQLWEYSPVAREWREILPLDGQGIVPTPRGGVGFCAINHRLHVLFGFDGTALADHFAFDLHEQKWAKEEHDSGPRPPARSVTDVVALPKIGEEGVLFVFGGEAAPSALGHEGAGIFLSDTWVYDLATRQWAQQQPGPEARGWFPSVATSDGRRVVIFGGFTGPDRINDVWVWQSQRLL